MASQYVYSSASNYGDGVGMLQFEKADMPIVDVLNVNNVKGYDSYCY